VDKDLRTISKKLIGSMVEYPELFEEIDAVVGDRKIFQGTLASLYDSLISTWKSGKKVDSATAMATLKEGSAEWLLLIDCLQSGTDRQMAVTYAVVLVEKFIRLRVRRLSEEISHKSEDEDIFGLMDWAESELNKLHISREGIASFNATSAMGDALKYVETAINERNAGVKRPCTGLAGIDSILGPLIPGDLTIVAARPSAGKTAFGLWMLRNCGLLGFPVDFFSFEMPAIHLSLRLISSMSRVNGFRASMGLIAKSELAEMGLAADKIQSLPIYFDECTGDHISTLKRRISRAHRERKVSVVIVDYLQLIAGNTKESREREVAGISKALKDTAMKLKIPIVCLSQLSRNVEYREGKVPQLSDLRESGAIEQDADNAVFLWSKDNNDDYRNVTVAKHRNGPIGTVTVGFRSEFGEFYEPYNERY
jgi:replicative DNA helicase